MLLVYGTKTGRVLGVTTAYDATVTLVLNDVGEASFFVPLDYENIDVDAATRLNAIIWLYKKGYPTFVGYIEERTINCSSNCVEVRARGAENILGGTITPQTLILGGSEGGLNAGLFAFELFKQALKFNIPLKAGVFDASGAKFGEYHYENILKIYQKLTEGHTAAFWVDENLQLHFRNARGVDKSSTYVLTADKLLSFSVTESIRDTRNAIVGLGEGTDLALRPKAAYYVPDTDFTAWIEVISYPNGADTIGDAVKTDVLRLCQPRRTFDVTVTPDVLEQISLGDIITIHTKYHPPYRALLTGVEFSDRVRLVFEQVITPAGYIPLPFSP